MRLRKCISAFLTMCMVMCSNSAGVFANSSAGEVKSQINSSSEVTADISESDGKKVTVIVSVDGIPNGTEASVVLKKEGEGEEPGVEITSKTTMHKVEFNVSPGGTCQIQGKDLPGYISPPIVNLPLNKFHGNFTKYVTLTYKEGTIKVSGIELNKNKISLIKGFSEQLIATVRPENASNIGKTWISSNPQIATVDNNGNVLAIDSGNTQIIVTTEEGNKSAVCEITVRHITGLESVNGKTVKIGEIVILPNTIKATLDKELDNKTEVDVPVIWQSATLKEGRQIINYDSTGNKELIGDIKGTDLKAKMTIIVKDGNPVVKVQKISLDKETMELLVGGKSELFATILPNDADTKGLIWTTSDESVATVKAINEVNKATVEGKKNGTAIISIKALDQDIVASCIVVVSTNSNPLPTDVYITATKEYSKEKVDQFNSREEVFIRGYNLEYDKAYYVKVEKMGKDKLLGNGTITFKKSDFIDTEVKFNLFQLTQFKNTDKNSNEYFVYMSTDEGFPKGDDESGKPKTLKINFKIGSPVPTGNIEVNVKELIKGQLALPANEMIGKDVILCRAIDGITILDTKYENYKNPLYGRTEEWIPEKLRNSKYNDEVKLIGKIQSNGTVKWDIPKEILKIGGYILLVELPNGYITNLNLCNPYTDAGELLKEVHIERDGLEHREIIVKKSNESTMPLKIYGFVKDDNGKILDGAQVQLFCAGKILKTTTTNKEGKYFFELIDRKTNYQLVIVKTGFKTVKKSIEVSGKSDTAIDFILIKENSGCDTDNDVVINDNTNTPVIDTNIPIKALPKTGGIPFETFMVLGAVLIGIGLALALRKCHRTKEIK